MEKLEDRIKQPEHARDLSRCSQCGLAVDADDLIQFKTFLVCGGCKGAFFQKIKEGVAVYDQTLSETYGSLEKGVQGTYDFKIIDILKEAAKQTQGSKRHILGGVFFGLLVFIPIGIAVGIIKTNFLGSIGNPVVYKMAQMVLKIIITVISYPIGAGLLMMGVNRSIHQPIASVMVFRYFHVLIPLAVVNFMMVVVLAIGSSLFITYDIYMAHNVLSLAVLGSTAPKVINGVISFLLLIPAIYLVVAYIMKTPLIAEKKLSAWTALETSRKAISFKWFQVFILLLILLGLLFISFVGFFIGLVWTVPLFVNAYGIMYRNIFGVSVVPDI